MRPNRLSALIVLFATCALGSIAQAREAVERALAVHSPDGAIEVRITMAAGQPQYEVSRLDKPVILESKLGVALADGNSFDRELAVVDSQERTFDETWTQPWGEKRSIRNHYNEIRVALARTEAPHRRMDVVFRVFDDGVGFRYEWPEQTELADFQIADELTQFVMAGDHESWWIPGMASNHYEYLYQRTPLREVPQVHTPFTMKTADGLHLSIHEAALTNYASMTLVRSGTSTLTAALVPWSTGVKVYARAPFKSPWRTIQISPDAGGLITSYLELNLNEPNALGDVSWVKPGKYAGVWWEMHLNLATWGSGPKHGATTVNVKKRIDFAAENGLSGVLVEGWNVGWDGDWINNGEKFRFATPYPDFDIKELSRYAAERGVKLIGHHETGGAVSNYERQLTEALDLYKSMGYAAVKTGYVNFGQGLTRVDDAGQIQKEWHYGQFMVEHHRKVVEEAAKRHIMVDIHEPVKDTGERRTYPNMMTREGARGQEYNAWSNDGGNPPSHVTTIPFTRMLAGPMDFTPGIFKLIYGEPRPNNRVNSTLTNQLALYVVLYSPLQMVPDLPENYAAHPDAFQFIKDVPTDWEDTRVLNASIGDYVTIVRQQRAADDWYIGSVTNEVGRTLEAPLDFLTPGVTYQATIYEDGENADWKTRPLDYRIRTETVTSETKLTLRLAPGGGTAIRLSPTSKSGADGKASQTTSKSALN